MIDAMEQAKHFNSGHRSDKSRTIRFSREDLHLFAEASHDRNPLHLSPSFARKTFLGEPVVFGILGVFACLGKIPYRCNSSLSRITVEFKNPIFAEVDYSIDAVMQSVNTASLRLSDGSKVLLKVYLTFSDRPSLPVRWNGDRRPFPRGPVNLERRALYDGACVMGKYQPDPAAFAALLERFGLVEQQFGSLPLAALLCSSYIVGMEQPGLQSLFCKLALEFHSHSLDDSEMQYESRVLCVNALNMLASELHLSASGVPIATGELHSLLMPESPTTSVAKLEELLSASVSLKGRVALVIGASRGLGAALTTALVLKGCTVLANFDRSEQEARRLLESLKNTAGRIVLTKGDAGDVSYCTQLQCTVDKEFGRLDFLFCNACPPLRPDQIEPSTIERINSYLKDALALVSVPMAVFLKNMEASSGRLVIISSLTVDTPAREWPHYVAMKAAVEALARVAALQFPKITVLLVRPPRLRTDLTNSPSGQLDATLPEIVAAQITQGLLDVPSEQVSLLAMH